MRGAIVWILFSALLLQISIASNVDDELSMKSTNAEDVRVTATSVITVTLATDATPKPDVNDEKLEDSTEDDEETAIEDGESNSLNDSVRISRKERNRMRYRRRDRDDIRDWSKYSRVHLYCSAYNDLEVFKNYRFKGGVRTWKTYYHKRFALKKGDVILVKIVTDHEHHYGGICSVQVELPGGFEFFSTGRSDRWTVSKGHEFGIGDDELEKLVDMRYKPERWVKPEVVENMSQKCPSYPYKASKAKYVWEKESKGWDIVYLRYVHRMEKKKVRVGGDECECIALPRTKSVCYYWTDEAKGLCDSKGCGQKYKCVGPAKRGAMNCIAKAIDSVVVPKYPGASECKHKQAGEEDRHVVPYDFP